METHRTLSKLIIGIGLILLISCNNEMANFTYEPITSTSFKEQDTLYTFQYMVSNKYLRKKKSFLFKKDNQNIVKNYYWFENGKIFKTQGNFSGKLLHGNYIEKYSSGQIKSKGKIVYGLKDKIWISYFETGKIRSVEKWNTGMLQECEIYNGNNRLIKDLKFRNNKKNGWEYVYDSVTLVSRVKFKNGKMKAYRHLNEL